MQETLLAMHNKRDTYDPGQPVTPWMFAIARYKLVDLLRGRAGREALHDPIDEDFEGLASEAGAAAQEARRDLSVWLERWQSKYPRLCSWVEANIEETFTFYRLPLSHHKHLKSTNMLERLNEEIKRRTHIVRIFCNAASCLRLVRALTQELHEDWIEATRYLTMDDLKEHKKLALQQMDVAA